MKLLRVLDLEEVDGLVEHHDLEHIGEFRHLKYLGLRNTGIAHLPKSLGKLHGLEELDIRGTYIAKLPSTCIHLTRLRRLHGGTLVGTDRLDRVVPHPMIAWRVQSTDLTMPGTVTVITT